MDNDAITVMLVDDHPVVRDGYRRLLESYPGITVVAEADDGETACTQYAELHPDIVVLDLNMPGIGGLETIRRLRAKDSKAKILMFTMHESKVMVNRALEAGAAGYLMKSSPAEEMVEAVRQVFVGKTFLDHDLPADIQRAPLSDNDPLNILTKREYQIFCVLAEGRSVSEIAQLISISPKTVGVHQTNLMNKLKLKNAAGLTRLAIRCGSIEA
ncbi:MAG: response regulator transcription factor [Gammaproteobacteria bacterium]|nr:response regulator transcription factor [Gammaproteobacteria bacterium]